MTRMAKKPPPPPPKKGKPVMKGPLNKKGGY